MTALFYKAFQDGNKEKFDADCSEYALGYLTQSTIQARFHALKSVHHLVCLVLWQLKNKSVCSGLWYVLNLFH